MPKEIRFLITGKGEHIMLLVKLANQYLAKGSVSIISKRSIKQEDEKLESLAKKYNFAIDFVDDINAEETIAKIKKSRSNICINFGGLWIFKEGVLNLFKGLIFNCHAANLPDYRGPGDYNWEILNDEKDISVIIHQLVRKVDAGAILIKKTRRFNKKDIYPIDFYRESSKLIKYVLSSFVKIISKSSRVTLTPQDHKLAAYWPRLKNTINGAIDLSWSKEDIKLFVNAFSEPFIGAFLFYRGQKIFIRDVEIFSRNKIFHPFMYGLIINKMDDYLEVIVGGGQILLKGVYDQKGNRIPFVKFRVGDRFYMPAVVLDKAKKHEVRRNK